MDIFIKQSGPRMAVMARLEKLAKTEQRSMAGMAWVLLCEALDRREADRKAWNALADPKNPQFVESGKAFKVVGTVSKVAK